VKSASVFTGLHQSEWTKSRLFGHLAAFPSVSALAICTKPAPRVAGRVVDFWQDKLHVAHRNHDPSAQVGKKLLQCNESP
jgi:hypothetical protein